MPGGKTLLIFFVIAVLAVIVVFKSPLRKFTGVA
jgi:hypothetical protein